MDKKWHDIILEESSAEYFQELKKFVDEEYSFHKVYPPKENIFECFKLTPFDNVKAVIVGQDPYHNEHQAHGLCFSVQKNVQIPPSLQNIYKELYSDLGITPPSHGNLSKWAKQGVLLLNNVLTVAAGQPLSHSNKGWEVFTRKIIELLNNDDTPKVFILWGSKAIDKKVMITNPHHLVLTANHPSPLSAYRGFFGCKHFSKTNKFLVENGRTPIDWNLN